MNNEFHKYDMHLYRDSFQNYKVYQIPKAQLIIADVPYNLGTNAYGSNPSWYVDGDNKNGESDKAGKKFFNSENEFRPAEFMHFCSKMLVKEPKEKGKAPCMTKRLDGAGARLIENLQKPISRSREECTHDSPPPIIFYGGMNERC